MLHTISWIDYGKLVLICLVGYYMYVLVKFFPKSLIKQRILGDKTIEQGDEWKQEVEAIEEARGEQEVKAEIYIEQQNAESSADEKEKPVRDLDAGKVGGSESMLAYELAREIKKLTERAGREKMVKEELKMSLRVLLTCDPYKELKAGPYREPVMMLIRSEVENTCAMRFDANELVGLWDR